MKNLRLHLIQGMSTTIQIRICSHLLTKNLKIKIHQTIIIPTVVHRCETWPFTWREEHRLRAFENEAMMRNLRDGERCG
jgi:hypothetical protein